MADTLEVGGGPETRFEPVELHNKAIKLGPALACPSAEGGDGGGLRHEPSTLENVCRQLMQEAGLYSPVGEMHA